MDSEQLRILKQINESLQTMNSNLKSQIGLIQGMNTGLGQSRTNLAAVSTQSTQAQASLGATSAAANQAVTDVAASLFYKLFVGSIVMLVFGYMGEAGLMSAMPAFIVGMLAWIYMIHTLWMGEGAEARNASGNAAVQTAYNTMMWIIIVGWAIYPLGYALGYLAGGVDSASLNLVYNLADFVNKILFGVVIWSAAVSDSES